MVKREAAGKIGPGPDEKKPRTTQDTWECSQNQPHALNGNAGSRGSRADIAVDPLRVRELQGGKVKQGNVIYWMDRDKRAHDNWALLYALEQANALRSSVTVVTTLWPERYGQVATLRQFSFHIKCLRETHEELSKLGIPLIVRVGAPSTVVPDVVDEANGSLLVVDFSPLREKVREDSRLCEKLSIPVHQVDAHNIVPAWVVSPKLEYAARTIRTKIHRVLDDFLTEFPSISPPPVKREGGAQTIDWKALARSIKPALDVNVREVPAFRPGESAAREALDKFLSQRLPRYAERRNDPTVRVQSDLSPYINFGVLSAQRAALEAKRHAASRNDYLEELIVRRELSDNFCFYNEHYDSLEGAWDWAKKTLRDHKNDKRSHVYSQEEFAEAKTHDELWNAAQLELVHRGKMHGFMRMYWAKKILEWTSSPEEALQVALYLNDKYSLDGRDPNGFVGVMWSICGVHDQGWAERAVFGKIRFMNEKGCKRKFNTAAYEAAMRDLERRSAPSTSA